MILTIVFIVSGACVLLLLLAKVWEMQHKKPFFLLGFISEGDHRIHHWSEVAARSYSELKEDVSFFTKKQVPLHTKNILNKTETLLKEKVEKHIGDIRNTRLLKPKSDISEFFKNMSEKEKENEEADISQIPEDKVE